LIAACALYADDECVEEGRMVDVINFIPSTSEYNTYCCKKISNERI
jgi:hypothetical protein